jgi:hypothetical protein
LHACRIPYRTFSGVRSWNPELFKKNHGVSVVPVVITGASEVNTAHGRYRTPKADLIGSLSVAFEQRRISIASGLDLADDLLGELKNFRAETSAATGKTKYSAPEGKHDDLLIAVALAVWWLEEKARHTITVEKLLM